MRYTAAAACLPVTGALLGCADATPLRVAYHPWPGYAPLELARHMRWWPQQPAIEAVRTASATQSMERLRARDVHAAALTLDEAIRVHAEGLPLAVVALCDRSLGADVVMAAAPPADGRWPRGLRLVHEDRAVGELMAHAWLARVGLRYADITPVYFTIDAHEAAWERGEVDVLVTYEPVASRLRARGLRVLFDSSELPPQYPIFDVLVARADALAAHRQGMRVLLQTLLLGQRHLYEQPLDSAYRLAPWLGMARNEVPSAFRGLYLMPWSAQRAWLAGEQPRLLTAMRSLAAFLVSLDDDHEGYLAAIDSLPAVRADFLPLEEP